MRSKYKSDIQRIKKNAHKGTKGYKSLSKLQANIKGWLFRQRRKRLLEKLGMSTKKKEKDFFGDEDEDDFDAEAFFGIKEENLESNNMGIDDDLMMKAIEIMT